ncbi:hypothetical protein, partial [Salmonella sp. s51228]|uniref:hypothetical protein n=1 Tax=Salmonella sp. s51228 TaxID=3159652 RepID=UPI0039802142
PVQVKGTTYNNPVPYSVYEGEYTIPFRLISHNDAIPVLYLHKDYNILYDYGNGTGNLEKVPSFTYNLNMYFFSFSKGEKSIRLIMGTSASGGLVCNNISVHIKTKKVKSRSLQTIQYP